VQIGSIKRRKVASLRRATEQISGNSSLFYRLNAIMLFLYATLWKDKLSFAPFYRYCRKQVSLDSKFRRFGKHLLLWIRKGREVFPVLLEMQHHL